MSVSPRGRVFSPPKTDGSVKVVLQKKADLVRFRFFSNEGLFWSALSSIFFLEVVILKSIILRVLCYPIFSLSSNWAYWVEVSLLALSAVNALSCFCVALKSILCNGTSNAELSKEQLKLLGLEKREESFLSRCGPTPTMPFSLEDKSKNDRQFSFNWLSALQFGAFRNTLRPCSRNLTSDSIDSNSFSCAEKSLSFLSLNGFSSNFETLLHSRRSLDDETDRSLAAEVGSRTSPYSKLTTSVHTTKQLENLFENTSRTNAGSTVGSSCCCSYSLQKQNAFNLGNQRSLLASNRPGYELGTSFTDDDHSKNVNDENGVISLVTGMNIFLYICSRIKVTYDRVSLSPIPLNLLKSTADLSATNDGGRNGDKGSGSRIVGSSTSNDIEDSTCFRIQLNAFRKSPRKSATSRRSESCERRRTTSISPTSTTALNSFVSAFSTSDTASANMLGKQISLSSAEILNQYKMDSEQFAISERALRFWICGTIIRPLVKNIDDMNMLLTKEYSSLHLNIGKSSVQALQSALSSKIDLFGTELPYLIPYLKVHEKQSYIVHRARILGADMSMKEYNWQSGGCELVEDKDQGEIFLTFLLKVYVRNFSDTNSYSPKEAPWGEHLPTDAQLIWFWFCTYLDARMAANSLANDIQTPFSSVYFLRKPYKPSALQCTPDSFYVYQVSIHPPLFELVVGGGRERFEMSHGPKNLWRTILLFLQHARLFNNSRVGELAINECGINIAHVLE
uniref:Transmembrane-like protein n=1 Tax=Syphacia muris TaxID=451379 RepID=A0A158R620_9BILA